VCAACPYREHELHTHEGIEAWALMQQAYTQLNCSNGSVIGLDYSAVLKMAEIMGCDTHSLAHLLPAIEAGLIEGLREHGRTATSDSPSSP